MSDLFLNTLNLSISAGYLVAAVVLLRIFLKKAPKWVWPLLWGLVALRLLVPFSVESVLSLLPSAQVIPPDIAYHAQPAIDTGFQAVDRVVNPVIVENFTPDPAASANPLQIWLEAGGWVWAAGAAVMLAYTLFSYLNLRRRVRGAGCVEKNIYRSRAVNTPFVLGLFRPRIYLPGDLSEEEACYIVAHEEAHLRRGDHIWKPLGFLLLSIHWFNPLMWVAYILLCRDIELACDEKVIKALGREDRADYSQALLHCSVSRRTIAACPLAFGEVGVKQRVKSVLSYKKPGTWIVALAVLTCIITGVCFLTNPKSPDKAMTLADVRLLGEQDSLQWADLEAYAFERVDETTRCYAIEGVDFTLTARGPRPGEFLRSVVLSCNLEDGTGIDIRNGGLDDYLAVHIQAMDSLAGNHWSVYATVDNPTPDGAEFLISYREEANNATFYTTEGYGLQTRGTNGDWENMPMLRKPDWSERRIPVGRVYTQKAEWEEIYGPLPDGDYRLCKEIVVEFPHGSGTEQFTAYSEFGVYFQGRTPLTEGKLTELLNDPERLDWADFEDYPYWTYSSPYFSTESLRYFRIYQIGEYLSLAISGQGPEEQLVRLLLQCSGEAGQMAFLYPNQKNPEYWDEEISQAVAKAREMQAFIKVHSVPGSDEHTNHFGIRFAIESADASGASVQLDASPTLDAQYKASDQYELQKFDGGTWVTLEPLRGQEWGDAQFREDNLCSQTINWESRYGVLTRGHYRLGKEIQIRDWDKKVDMPIWSPLMVYDEFTLDPTQ